MSGFEIIEISTSGEAPKETREDVNEDNNNDNNQKWQKLVLYYLARLKGLCDWRNNSRTITNQKLHLNKCPSQELESKIIDKITYKTTAQTSKQSLPENFTDVGCYLAAGYEEGKLQAVKIISRSLKYGVMTGILLKRGNCYRIAPEYLCEGGPSPVEKKKNVHGKNCDKCLTRHKFSVKSVKSNVRKKDKKNVKKRASKYKITEQRKSNTGIRGKKRKRALNNTNVKKKRVNSPISMKKGTKRVYEKYDERYEYNDKYDDRKSENSDAPKYKRNKRSSDTNLNINEFSTSNTSFQTLSRSQTPIEDRHKKRDVKPKRLRPKIQKPINYVPPLKKPRTESQSKSPSHHTDDDEVKDQNGKNKPHKMINQFRMPRPRRYSDVMSSMSSSSCTIYDEDERHYHQVKRTRRK